MGNTVPDWQTFIRCSGGKLIIRHLKQGLAKNLEIPWPAKLTSIEFEKVSVSRADIQPLSQCQNSLDTVELKGCEIEPGALSVLSSTSSLRCLIIENCNIADSDFEWFGGTPKLEILDLTGNAQCTGAVTARAAGSPLRILRLNGTNFQDSDIPILLSFPTLETLTVSDTKVTGGALPQLAVNTALDVICGHDRAGMSLFRAAQRRNLKKKLSVDEAPAKEAAQLLKDFYEASQKQTKNRSRFITSAYSDYCKNHGYSGLERCQKISAAGAQTPPYSDYRVTDAEQVTSNKFYIYSERDDLTLSQYRSLVVKTADGWKIDKNEWLSNGKWRFLPLK